MRTSAADFAMGPGLSKNSVMQYSPVLFWIPTVGLRAYRAARVEGVTIDPIVSVPMARGAKPAATETAEPVDEPPGACPIFFQHYSVTGRYGACLCLQNDRVTSHFPPLFQRRVRGFDRRAQTSRASSWSFSCLPTPMNSHQFHSDSVRERDRYRQSYSLSPK
jgi:hypothetical protein